MQNTEEFFRPCHAVRCAFDGVAALAYFESRGYSKQGHTLAVGEDEAGPYFRLLEVSSGSSKRVSQVWSKCFGAKKQRTAIDLTQEVEATNEGAAEDEPNILEIYDENWTRPSLFRVEMPTGLEGLEPHCAEEGLGGLRRPQSNSTAAPWPCSTQKFETP